MSEANRISDVSRRATLDLTTFSESFPYQLDVYLPLPQQPNIRSKNRLLKKPLQLTPFFLVN